MENAKREPLRRARGGFVLFCFSAFLLAAGLVLVLIDGPVTRRRPVEYAPYRAGLAPDTAVEASLVSCERPLSAREEIPVTGPAREERGARMVYTYALCRAKGGDPIVLCTKRFVFDDAGEGPDAALAGLLSPLADGGAEQVTVRGRTARPLTSLQVPVSADEAAALREALGAETHVVPYFGEAPAEADVTVFTFRTDTAGRALAACGLMLLLCLGARRFAHLKKERAADKVPAPAPRQAPAPASRPAKACPHGPSSRADARPAAASSEWELEKAGLIKEKTVDSGGLYVTALLRLARPLEWSDILGFARTLANERGALREIRTGDAGDDRGYVLSADKMKDLSSVPRAAWLKAEGASLALGCVFRLFLYDGEDALRLQAFGTPPDAALRDFIGSLLLASLPFEGAPASFDMKEGRRICRERLGMPPTGAQDAPEEGSVLIEFSRLDIHPADHCDSYLIPVREDMTAYEFLKMLALRCLPGVGLYEWTVHTDGGVLGTVGGPDGIVCGTPDAALGDLGVRSAHCVPEPVRFPPRRAPDTKGDQSPS